MRIGYARVSTLEQNLDLQVDALRAAGCEKVYTDKTGGTMAERPGLERALADLRAGDRLVVGGTNHEALAVSPYTGDVLGRQKLSGAASLRPIVVDGTVFIVTDDGRLLALR